MVCGSSHAVPKAIRCEGTTFGASIPESPPDACPPISTLMHRALVEVCASVALCLITATLAYSSLSGPGLYDYGSFILAGQASEKGLNPYGVHEALVGESGLNLGFDNRAYSPNLNPPVSIYPFRLLASTDPGVTRYGLRAVSAVVYVAGCLALMRAYPWQRRPLAVLWLIAGAGFWYTLWMGQIYVLLFGTGLGAWLLLEKGQNPVLAGVLIGVTVAVKPNFALWPLLLLLAGHGRPAVWAGITALLISAIPLVVEGPSIYGQWLDAARHYSRGALAANGSLVGTAARLGFEPAGYALAGALTLAGAVYARRMRPGVKEASAMALLVTLLAGPLTWLGYTLFALPVLMSRRWRCWELAVGATLVVPAGLTAAAGEVHLAGMLLLGGLVAGDAIRSRRTVAEVEPSRSAALTVEAA
jgi:hypothetical protein